MKNSKLISVLGSLEKKEWKALAEFLASPYFNKNKDLCRLLELLRKEFPAFDPDRTDRYFIWRKLFPRKAPEEQEIKYLMSSLLRLVERFLGQQDFESVPMLQEFHIINACEERNLGKHYRLYRKRLEKAAREHPYRNEHFYLHQHQLAGVAAKYFWKQQVRTFDQNLQDTVNFLDDFYLITKLRLTCELINRQNILSSSYDIRLVDELLSYLGHYDYESVPAMDIYYRILLLLTSEPTHDQFRRLKKLLATHLSLFPDREKKEIYSYAQNFCIQMIKKGEHEFLEELFQLYQTGLDQDLLMEDGVLSPWKFKNIVSGGLRLGYFEWVEKFIRDYHAYLPEDFRETAMQYNQANLLYHKGRHHEAMRLLSRVEFSDVFYSLDTRKMMLMIYFELGETEALLSLIASFRLYLRRNKLISERNRKAYKHFVSAVQTLFRMEEGKSDVDFEKYIGEMQPVVEEEWLLKKSEKYTRD